jgi:uncharacterized paraquat-inducible protein A
MICFAAATFIYFLCSLGARVGPPALLAGAALLVVAFACVIVNSVWRRSVLRRVRAGNCEVCTECLYPLPEQAGVCPECGTSYRLGDVRAVWERWLGWLSLRTWLTGTGHSRDRGAGDGRDTR